MKNNITNLIKQELVNQFEHVVKNEIRSHEKSVESTNRSLNELKNTLESIQKEQENIKARSEFLYIDTLKNFVKEKDQMQESFDEQRRFIRDSAKKLDNALLSITESFDGSVCIETFLEWKDHSMKVFSSIHKKIEDKFTEISESSHKSYVENRSYIHENAKMSQDNHQDILKEIDRLILEISVNKVDSVGVLRELQVYKKTMFVMEKKIEDLYNKLSKIQKRVEVCPNPV